MTTSPRCIICHRALKNPEAVSEGIGRVCARKMGRLPRRKLRKARVSPLFDLKEQTLGVPLFQEAL